MPPIIKSFSFVVLFLMLSACMDTVKPSNIKGSWILNTLNDEKIAPTTLTIGEDNKINGRAACNSYFSTAEITQDQISFGPIGATRMSCPKLNDETAYFEVLQEIKTVSLNDEEQLVLTGNNGILVFDRQSE